MRNKHSPSFIQMVNKSENEMYDFNFMYPFSLFKVINSNIIPEMDNLFTFVTLTDCCKCILLILVIV